MQIEKTLNTVGVTLTIRKIFQFLFLKIDIKMST